MGMHNDFNQNSRRDLPTPMRLRRWSFFQEDRAQLNKTLLAEGYKKTHACAAESDSSF